MASALARFSASLASFTQCDEHCTCTLQKPAADTRFDISVSSLTDHHPAIVVRPGRWAEAGVLSGDRVITVNRIIVRAQSTADSTRWLSPSEHAAQLLSEAPAGDVTMVISRKRGVVPAHAKEAPTEVQNEADAKEVARRLKRVQAWRPEADSIKEKHPQWICPLTYEVFHDPVVASDGQTYERAAIERWLSTSTMSPLTGQPLRLYVLIDNIALRSIIEQYVDEHQSIQITA